MSPSLIDRRPRAELIAELYDRHATGLFAYIHDQLGDTASAADALVAVLTGVPAVETPRAALYALARREIYRRDVAYAFPTVDAVTDPATALIERVVREIRPHQREVLLLSAICGLDAPELAWVLDVAADTAEQLDITARHRFTRSLSSAVAAARSGPPVPAAVAEVYEALTVAPAEDALARLPWRSPPTALRAQVLNAVADEAGAAPAPRRDAESLWPTTPRWPLPLAEPNPVTATGVFPAAELSPPEPGVRSRHEATTEPMPKLRDVAPPGALAATPLAAPVSAPAPASAMPLAAPVPLEALDDDIPLKSEHASPPDSAFGKALATGQWPTLRRTFKPLPRRRRQAKAPDKPVAGEPAEESPAVPAADGTGTFETPEIQANLPEDGPLTDGRAETPPAEPKSGTTASETMAGPAGETADDTAADAAADALGDPVVAAPVAIDPAAQPETVAPEVPESPAAEVTTEKEPGAATVTAEAVVPADQAVVTPDEGAKGRRCRHKKAKPVKVRERHYDWLWELVGILLCVAIGLLVFFAVPTLVTP
ncbi:hypothetical protein Ssi03_54070 [Sphaerisporangium siamense]|uniref:DNA-directed RNA polymerase specialized sigma24 family protein n=1 Tax=Sphaerisporangium siamense TaxID=795645 RepID=A0A7W7GA11_9ACTN|nr:hypothetical protein [Sphaerisporangium siamense]MBB4701215.1 DNA-directed RNA polymerase specialized sigma24 family protein [Sphaerisporangium siamense]GII87417.1 hypothetical protein Ssi03_54070 [Sphaerisporangium siamense]